MKSIWSEGFKPVPYDTENLERYMHGARIKHAHEIVPHGFIQVVFENRFVSFGELYYFAKSNDLTVDTIYAVKDGDDVNIQVNFYRGFEDYE